MKAVRFHAHGGPEALRYEDAPEPVIADGEVLVRVRACALNHLDIWGRVGRPGVEIPLPHVCGSDVAGEVVDARAPGVSSGRRVMLQPGMSCGACPACLAGRDNECAEYEVLGYVHHAGGYAEYVKVPAQNIVPIPDEVDYVTAAAFPLTFLTAWHMLFTRAQLKAGEDVLVFAAGSGVGQAAIQLAVRHGARVIATVGSAEKGTRALALGARATVNHRDQDVAAEVMRLTERRGVDVVIEHIGEAVWPQALRSLARGGRLVTCGATSGANGAVNLAALFARRLTLHGSYMGAKGELLKAARLFFSGQVRPVVDRTFPLAHAAEAQRHMERSAHFGKIVLEV